MEPAPRVFTAFSINLNVCPADQLKNKYTKKKPQNPTPQSPLSSTADRDVFDAALPSVPLCREYPRFQTQSTWLCYLWQAEAELQCEHGVCTMIGQMDTLLASKP